MDNETNAAAEAGVLAKKQLLAAELVCQEYFSEPVDIVVQLAVAQLIATNMAALPKAAPRFGVPPPLGPRNDSPRR